MKKKISFFALLFSLMLAFIIPIQTKAADDLEEFLPLPEDFDHEYIVGVKNNTGVLLLYGSDSPFYKKTSSDDSTYCDNTNVYKLKLVSGVWTDDGTTDLTGKKISSSIRISNHNIYFKDGSLAFAANFAMPYTFDEWCFDAGLSCAASSNESSSVIPFWYEPDFYDYIVRKTLTASSTSGVYQLTMIQKNDSSLHYPYYFEVNDIGYLGIAGTFHDISTFTVRNFYYDADGDGWKYIERFDVSSLPFDNTNVTFTENVVFIYSDTDIFADRDADTIWQAASTEYYNVDVITPTPTTVPGSGSGGNNSSGGGRPGSGTRPDTGGQATGGGGLDFIINLFTLIWTKICSVPVAVDGYSISLQQIFIYGALVSIVGGFILHFIFGRK